MFDQPSYDQHLAPGGTLSVEARLARRGRALAKVTLKIPVEADRRYLVYAAVQRNDPTLGCMGCIGLKWRSVPGDRWRRLWVYYSFNGISHPILF